MRWSGRKVKRKNRRIFKIIIKDQNIGGLMLVASLFNCFFDGLGLELDSESDLGGLFWRGLTLTTGCLDVVASVWSFLRYDNSQSSGFCIKPTNNYNVNNYLVN